MFSEKVFFLKINYSAIFFLLYCFVPLKTLQKKLSSQHFLEIKLSEIKAKSYFYLHKVNIGCSWILNKYSC